MDKRTYLNNQYTLYHHSDNSPELRYQDFTLRLTPEGTIHLTTPSKEFDSIANLFKTIQYWKDSHYEYADTLIGLEMVNAISEVMLYSGLRFSYFMAMPYYDFINASLVYYKIDIDFWIYYYFYSKTYLKPYPTAYIRSKAYTNPLEKLGISPELTLPLTFSKRDEGYFMALSFSNDGFLESPIHTQVAEMPDNTMKLRSYYRMLCSLLYHSGYALTEDGKLYSNKCYILRDDHKAVLEKLLQKMKEV